MPHNLSKTRFKYLVSLQHKKTRQKEKKFIIEGLRFCREALQSDYIIETLFYTHTIAHTAWAQELMEMAKNRGVEPEIVVPQELKKFTDTIQSQGVACLIRMPSRDISSLDWARLNSVVALDAVGEPGNLGTIIRSADWFNIDAVLLGHGCVELYNPKLLRSTAGSIFHLPVFENINLSSELVKLKEYGFRICAGDVYKGTPVNAFEWPDKLVLVMGSEPRGISSQVAPLIEHYIRIPKLGKAESLNVATATGILLFSRSESKFE